MSNTNTYKVTFTIIGNHNCEQAVTFSPSIRKALKQAESKAWDAFYNSRNTNWADCWVVIHNPRHKQIFAGFESDLSRA